MRKKRDRGSYEFYPLKVVFWASGSHFVEHKMCAKF